ncbi:methyltransferase type 12 [Sorangium cellulosum]|uniref:Small RNA 2'-O-methyltransferase n=1 Tax=Sorangium cellulosum TaxID=56 RepID=A0A2L0EQX3_SORCE|nr:3' terminal RNA ribose 2'-O-methyltransferase Hen1 [Sorangium cellulosum]AUX41684.1 methyltransferase type 12 [Sorangium cellulosum]
MLLTLTTTRPPATDLGYLLVKNPAHTQSFPLSFGKAHVFYPEATEARCTAALLLDVDPVDLVRGRGPGDPGTLAQYVNDRPYVASSFLSVAIAQVFGSALGGKCRDRPELADEPLPLVAMIEALPCRGGEALLRRLFEPLGYEVTAERLPLDEVFPEWGQSVYLRVALARTCRLRELLAHLYVLVPVLDDKKHYYVGDAEVENLLHKGEGWLAGHPEREAIALRYLKHSRPLFRAALARLVADEDASPEEAEDDKAAPEDKVEARISLDEARRAAVIAALRRAEARSVIDLGCGEGKLLKRLVDERVFERVAGADVSVRSLEIAKERLRLDDLPDKQKRRIQLFQASVTYRDARFSGYDAATLVEVIEHVDPPRLGALARTVFGSARPRVVVVTTPNAEYNVRFEGMPAGALRHGDHRFEWTRAEFHAFCGEVAAAHGYTVEHLPVGPMDPAVGAPTQMAVFTREDAEAPRGGAPGAAGAPGPAEGPGAAEGAGPADGPGAAEAEGPVAAEVAS